VPECSLPARDLYIFDILIVDSSRSSGKITHPVVETLDVAPATGHKRFESSRRFLLGMTRFVDAFHRVSKSQSRCAHRRWAWPTPRIFNARRRVRRPRRKSSTFNFQTNDQIIIRHLIYFS